MISKRSLIILIIYCVLFVFGCNNRNRNHSQNQNKPDTLVGQSKENKKVVDTTRGVFLIFKLGSNLETIRNAKEYLIKKRILTQVNEPQDSIFGPKIHLYYKLPLKPTEYKPYSGNVRIPGIKTLPYNTTDEKFDLPKPKTIKFYDASAEIFFYYSEDNILYKIELYFSAGNETEFSDGESMFPYIREDAEIMQRRIYDVYSSKYKSWIIKKNKLKCYNYFHKEKDLEISIIHTGCGVSVNYIDTKLLKAINAKPLLKVEPGRNVMNEI
ncbi:MAG: hypothetical protein Q8903_00255 [Bacteroidota bacterium]|nr:hypothetical protein [Bacteroidota bacterium]